MIKNQIIFFLLFVGLALGAEFDIPLNQKRADGTNIQRIVAPVASGVWRFSAGKLPEAGSIANLKTDLSLGNVTNDAQTKAAVVPNTLPSAGQILVGNAGGTAYAPLSMSGDATLASTGAITIGNNKVTGAMLALGSDAQGDLMFYDGTDWVRLAAGTSGWVLKTQGAGANPIWAAVTGTGTVTHTGGALTSGQLVFGAGGDDIAVGNLSGDVTTSGSGATTIAADAVTYAKMQNVSATSRILGRITSGAGDVEELTAANVKTILGLVSSDVGLGNVTNDVQTKAAVVPNTAPSAGQILVGNAGGTAYAPVSGSGDVTIASTGAFTIANNAVITAKVADAQITLAKIQNAAANSKLLGSGAAGSGAAYVELTLGTGLSMSGTTLNATAGGIPTQITVANEATDTTAFPLFVVSATGDLEPKTSNFWGFDSNTGAMFLQSASAAALTVGRQGATDPAFKIDASAASSATGIAITSAAAGSRVTITAISSGTNEGLGIEAKGSGTIRLGQNQTGNIEFYRHPVPFASDGAQIGTSSLPWSDLYLANGGFIDWNVGNARITHSSGLLTFNVPITLGTSNSITAGSFELGNASDTSVTRTAAGKAAIEGKAIPLSSGSSDITFTGPTAARTYTMPDEDSKIQGSSASKPVEIFSMTIDGNGSTITTGEKKGGPLPHGCTVTEWEINTYGTSGSIVLDVWVEADPYDGSDVVDNYPADADSIAASALPTLSSSQGKRSTTLTSWGTAITARSYFSVNVDSVTTFTKVTLTLRGTKP